MSVPADIVEALAGAERVLVTSHVPPDGDGLGTGIALVRTLKARGAEAVFAAGGPIQSCLEFLVAPGEVDYTPEGPPGPFDLALVIDAATYARTGAVQPLCQATPLVVNIDHHASNERFGHLNWVEGDSPAVGEMVYRLLVEMGVVIDDRLALPLYTALVTDTGRFGYPSTTPASHRMAARLLETGIPPQELTDRIYRSISPAYMELQRLALARLEIVEDGLAAHLTVTPEMVRESGADPLDVGDLVDLPISLRGTEVGILFRTAADGVSTKVSLRSRRWFQVNRFAARWGGGGHERAAGATVPAPLDDARAEVLASLREEIEGGAAP